MSQPNQNAATTVLTTVSIGIETAPSIVLIHSQPELLTMVLSHLDIRSLTRALSVLKYWQETILGAIELRQNLFLAPKADVEEFLEWEFEELEWVPLIVHESTLDNRPIIKLHPVLAPDPRACTCLDMYQRHRLLKTVSPSMLLTQPAVTEVKLEQELHAMRPGHALRAVMKREGGVIFGDVVKEIEALRARGKAGESVAVADGFGGFLFIPCSNIDDVSDLDEDEDDDLFGATFLPCHTQECLRQHAQTI
jgi:hypothetical protein